MVTVQITTLHLFLLEVNTFKMRKSCPLHADDRLGSCSHLMPLHDPLDRGPVLDLCEEMSCSLGVDVSSLPSDIRGTTRHLASRHIELAQWQSLTALGMSRVEREIDALEQLKLNIESQLEERHTYAKFIGECVQFKEDFDQFVHDDVYLELKKEQQLTNEIISTLQNHTCVIQGQIAALKAVYSELHVDYQDKAEAIRLTAKCITHNHSPQSQQRGPKKWHISYDNWKSECNKLQYATENELKKSTSLRGNIQFTLANLKSAYERQRLSTNKAMRKKIHDMKKTEEQMRWKRQQALDEMEDLKKTLQKVAAQIRNCESRKMQNANNLDTLNQRQRNELCLDQAHNSLTLQKCDLALIASGLERMSRRVHNSIEAVRRRMPILDAELEAQGSALQTEQKCQDIYQSILPLHRTSVGPNNSLGPVDNEYSLQ